VAVCQYAEHDVKRHYVTVVVMVTDRCVFAAVDERFTCIGRWTDNR